MGDQSDPRTSLGNSPCSRMIWPVPLPSMKSADHERDAEVCFMERAWIVSRACGSTRTRLSMLSGEGCSGRT